MQNDRKISEKKTLEKPARNVSKVTQKVLTTLLEKVKNFPEKS